ncbi:hypothetical protein CS063_16895 [Sporanaerobium hydrogeniformans]|uniref:Uncharacterized protein n=1 Tax=Sporanaerobium hydrogeniformans TaxID=3072179 RepID=A0AC61D695_9FIRM|nr:ECF transporter S component [Sporanaerobium hydrogeniformans]PHV69241.1 hypothetical protein CS063_16895 [Sporanaerobium hydrogeniformans]
MDHKQSRFSLKVIILIGLFSAICYVALFFKIPIPSPVGNPFLHMGNMFVILAALLFSGTIGGLSGSIGMGFFDLMNGYVDSVPKTALLKLGIGLITGLIASKGHNKAAKSPLKWIALAATVCILAGLALLAVSLTFGNEIAIQGIEKKFVVIPMLYIFSFLLGIGLSITCVFIKKLSIKLQYAIIGAVAGIAFNLLGEFLFGTLKLLLVGSTFVPAVIGSAISLPATLINGVFSIIVAIILYIPLSKILEKMHLGI